MPNIPTICRICEESSEATLVNFTLPENKDLVVEFLACANVSYNIHDKLPKYFCHQCIITLNTAYHFRGQCERTEKKLLKLLCKETNSIRNLSNEKNDLTLKPDDTLITDVNPLEFLKTEDDFDNDSNDSKTEHLETNEVEVNVYDLNEKILIKEENCYQQDSYEIRRKKLSLFKCDICLQQFKYKKNLERHMMTHSRSFTCDICNKSFGKKVYLVKHMGVHCDKSLECDKCTKKFSSIFRLKCHIKFHSKSTDKPYKCLLCPSSFRHKESLDNHASAPHPAKKIQMKTFICAICGFGCVSAAHLKNHMIHHSDERPFACSLCDLTFKHKPSLKSHMRTHTGEKPYNCSECDKAFPKRDTLIKHQKIHTDERPYQCTICNERFRTKVTMAHMTRHTGEKPFDCKFCEKSFPIYSKLKRHIRIHTDEKPFACTLCNLGYKKLEFLEKHLKTHVDRNFSDGGSGQYPIEVHEQFFKCTWCSGAFLSSRSLKFHQAKHSGGKSFVCTHCGQGFSTVNNLNDHITVYHVNVVSQ